MRREANNWAIGYEFYVADKLEEQGFKYIKMTPRTGDFGADILCFDNLGASCAIQCKLYSRKIGYKAVEEAIAGARYYKCQRALLITNIGFTKNAIHGARQLGVELFVCKFHPIVFDPRFDPHKAKINDTK